jgi:hypothetical protein
MAVHVSVDSVPCAFSRNRTRPDSQNPALGITGWSINAADRALIERIVNTTVTDPVGPEFMAPLQRA